MVIELGRASVETNAVFALPQECIDPIVHAQKPYHIGCCL
jgi:hypothetical protein